jgi:hypothetical protein
MYRSGRCFALSWTAPQASSRSGRMRSTKASAMLARACPQAVWGYCMPKRRKSARPAPGDPPGAHVASDTTNMEVGPPIDPKERTHMPLSAVAHWIASEGGAISITADEKWWHPAFKKLLAVIVSDRLAVAGRRRGLPEPIPNVVFVGIPLAYPCSSNSLHLWTGDGPYLQGELYIDEADWEATGGDKLFRSGRDTRAEWTHLVVPSSAVARLWRFSDGRTANDERVATSALAMLLREQPGLTRENARRHCDGFGRVAFKRIWQNARRSAGLPAKASPGRPAKTKR